VFFYWSVQFFIYMLSFILKFTYYDCLYIFQTFKIIIIIIIKKAGKWVSGYSSPVGVQWITKMDVLNLNSVIHRRIYEKRFWTEMVCQPISLSIIVSWYNFCWKYCIYYILIFKKIIYIYNKLYLYYRY